MIILNNEIQISRDVVENLADLTWFKVKDMQDSVPIELVDGLFVIMRIQKNQVSHDDFEFIKKFFIFAK